MDLRHLASIDTALSVLAHPNAHVCFSQFGEDMVIAAMLLTLGRDRTPGFYVDVGAFDPVCASNTCMLHLRGWSGVNIDANPDAIEKFRQMRPHDRNVHAAVSDQEAEVEFDIFSLAALSTADPSAKAAYAQDGRGQLVRRLDLRTRRLRDILDETVDDWQSIDLMSVDVEGFDLAVLRSNNWNRYAPHFLLVEDAALSLQRPQDSGIFSFLQPLGYRLASQTYITSIYVLERAERGSGASMP